MTTLVDRPESGRGVWRFSLAGIPVTVQPWFWLTTIFMGANRDVGGLLVWIAVCFVSILLHEMGHVMAYRAFGERGEILLYSWGGLAFSDRNARRTTLAQVMVSLAGPAAGFCLAGLVLAVAFSLGALIHTSWAYFVMPNISAVILPHNVEALNGRAYYYWNVVLNDLLWVNISWGLVNLLPVYPLDGGQASRALFEAHDRSSGLQRSLWVSVIAAGAIALMGLMEHDMYVTIMFGLLAFSSVQLLEQFHRPSWMPGSSRR
jgi:stage IV sporulation protein FB